MNPNSSQSTSMPIPGAAYIRYSSEMQSDSFSLDAQLRQIKEQAARDGVDIIVVFSDPAQSAYSKKYRPGINAMREAARRGQFKILYVHKVDRLARRLEWSLEIVHELQSLDINFKAVEQPFDLRTPEGKLLFHLVSSLGEFYSDNLSKETNKGKLERSTQGFHNGAVPWGYISQVQGNRKVGVPDQLKAPAIVELFERYASGLYSDFQLAEWMNSQGFITNRGHPFGKDTIRDMLCNSFYIGQIKYRGMTVHTKGVSYRSTEPRIAKGQHVPIVSEDLWQRVHAVRAARRQKPKSGQKTVRIHLLQGIAICASCGQRLRIQTPKGHHTYYRDESNLRGYPECPNSGQSIRAVTLDEQIAELVQSLKLPANWEESVRQLLQVQKGGPDPEIEAKDIRGTLRLMRDNYERGMYKGEEYVYWKKVNELKEKLELLNRVPDKAIDHAARTLLDLHGSWEWATREEQKELVHMMIQEAACDLTVKRILWVRVRPDFEVLFQLVKGLYPDAGRRYWIEDASGRAENENLSEHMGQKGTEVKILVQLSNNALTSAEEYIK